MVSLRAPPSNLVAFFEIIRNDSRSVNIKHALSILIIQTEEPDAKRRYNTAEGRSMTSTYTEHVYFHGDLALTDPLRANAPARVCSEA
jgi:hypothetical protein